LFQDWLHSVAAKVIAPLVDVGRRGAEVDRTEAATKQRLYAYGQAVLEAFQQVEDALISETKQVEQVRSLQAQLNIAERALKQLRLEYFNGQVDFIDVLTAQDDEQQLRRDLLAARLRRIELRIALYRSLAGGFATGRATGADREHRRALAPNEH